ncbi:MAG: hypothetical protein SNJ52_01225, partial [Verrucomicrobiia bacterium]
MNYVSNFLEILQRVSGTTIELLDANQPLSELIDGELVDTDDFDTALVAFEITHHVVVDCEDLSGEEIGELSVRTLLETHLIKNHPDLENPDRHHAQGMGKPRRLGSVKREAGGA